MSEEKKEAKPAMPSCRLCGTAEIDLPSYGVGPGRVEASSGCCLLCAARRDAFAVSLVNGVSGDFSRSPAQALAWARAIYTQADALVVGRAFAELPKDDGSKAS